MTESQVIALMVQGAAVLVALIGTVGTVAVALINGRISRLKDSIVRQHGDWVEWTDALIAEVQKLVGGQQIVDSMPPRPKLHLRWRDEEDE